MARTVKDVRLDTRAARSRLASRKKPYYRAIEHGRHLGYYKGATGGSWLARTNDGGRYVQRALGAADDVREANGVDVLSFAQAQAAARDWFDQLARSADALGGSVATTVRAAVERYVAAMDARLSEREGRPVKSLAAGTMRRHVLSNDKLADCEVHELTVAALRDWRNGLAVGPSTRQRVTNDLTAALNEAAANSTIRLTIKEGLASPKGGASSAAEPADVESKVINDDETRRFLAAIRDAGDDDLYRLCLVMAATGARFAQLRRMTVRDVQAKQCRLMVPASLKGRVGSTSKRPSVPVPVGQDVIDALLPAVCGRKADAPLFERWRHKQTGPATWVRDSRGPWQSAAELARPLRAAAKAANLPDSVSAYSFRHGSIVRALGKGLPVRLVAQLHDTSIAMIERNYTRFMADALEDLARTAIVPMVTVSKADNVVPIARVK